MSNNRAGNSGRKRSVQVTVDGERNNIAGLSREQLFELLEAKFGGKSGKAARKRLAGLHPTELDKALAGQVDQTKLFGFPPHALSRANKRHLRKYLREEQGAMQEFDNGGIASVPAALYRPVTPSALYRPAAAAPTSPSTAISRLENEGGQVGASMRMLDNFVDLVADPLLEFSLPRKTAYVQANTPKGARMIRTKVNNTLRPPPGTGCVIIYFDPAHMHGTFRVSCYYRESMDVPGPNNALLGSETLEFLIPEIESVADAMQFICGALKAMPTSPALYALGGSYAGAFLPDALTTHPAFLDSDRLLAIGPVSNAGQSTFNATEPIYARVVGPNLPMSRLQNANNLNESQVSTVIYYPSIPGPNQTWQPSGHLVWDEQLAGNGFTLNQNVVPDGFAGEGLHAQGVSMGVWKSYEAWGDTNPNYQLFPSCGRLYTIKLTLELIGVSLPTQSLQPDPFGNPIFPGEIEFWYQLGQLDTPVQLGKGYTMTYPAGELPTAPRRLEFTWVVDTQGVPFAQFGFNSIINDPGMFVQVSYMDVNVQVEFANPEAAMVPATAFIMAVPEADSAITLTGSLDFAIMPSPQENATVSQLIRGDLIEAEDIPETVVGEVVFGMANSMPVITSALVYAHLSSVLRREYSEHFQAAALDWKGIGQTIRKVGSHIPKLLDKSLQVMDIIDDSERRRAIRQRLGAAGKVLFGTNDGAARAMAGGEGSKVRVTNTGDSSGSNVGMFTPTLADIVSRAEMPVMDGAQLRLGSFDYFALVSQTEVNGQEAWVVTRKHPSDNADIVSEGIMDGDQLSVLGGALAHTVRHVQLADLLPFAVENGTLVNNPGVATLPMLTITGATRVAAFMRSLAANPVETPWSQAFLESAAINQITWENTAIVDLDYAFCELVCDIVDHLTLLPVGSWDEVESVLQTRPCRPRKEIVHHFAPWEAQLDADLCPSSGTKRKHSSMENDADLVLAMLAEVDNVQLTTALQLPVTQDNRADIEGYLCSLSPQLVGVFLQRAISAESGGERHNGGQTAGGGASHAAAASSPTMADVRVTYPNDHGARPANAQPRDDRHVPGIDATLRSLRMLFPNRAAGAADVGTMGEKLVSATLSDLGVLYVPENSVVGLGRAPIVAHMENGEVGPGGVRSYLITTVPCGQMSRFGGYSQGKPTLDTHLSELYQVQYESRGDGNILFDTNIVSPDESFVKALQGLLVPALRWGLLDEGGSAFYVTVASSEPIHGRSYEMALWSSIGFTPRRPGPVITGTLASVDFRQAGRTFIARAEPGDVLGVDEKGANRDIVKPDDGNAGLRYLMTRVDDSRTGPAHAPRISEYFTGYMGGRRYERQWSMEHGYLLPLERLGASHTDDSSSFLPTPAGRATR